jgi:hypothetical protein
MQRSVALSATPHAWPQPRWRNGVGHRRAFFDGYPRLPRLRCCARAPSNFCHGYANGSGLVRQAVFEATKKFGQGDTECLADLSKLEQIEPSFAYLVLANERLWLAEKLGDVGLS